MIRSTCGVTDVMRPTAVALRLAVAVCVMPFARHESIVTRLQNSCDTVRRNSDVD
jgi:hypothetical protein